MPIKKSYSIRVAAACAAFAVCEAVLHVLIIGRLTSYTSWLDVISIVLCLLFTFAVFPFAKERLFLVCGLFFSCISELFLNIILEYTQGMFVFSLAQICYAAFLFAGESRRMRVIDICVRVIALVTFFTVALVAFSQTFNLLLGVSAVYISLLVCSVGLSAKNVKKNPLAFVGFLLFLFCDFFIALGMSEPFVQVGGVLLQMRSEACRIAWVFYIPAQSLLALCVLYGSFNIIFKKQKKQTVQKIAQDA